MEDSREGGDEEEEEEELSQEAQRPCFPQFCGVSTELVVVYASTELRKRVGCGDASTTLQT
jgi:hypothetical protein